MADSWNMLISEKGETLHFHLAWTGETSSIKLGYLQYVLHESHRAPRTVITYNALVSSLATPNQRRWRWVLMYLEDMQVASQCIAFIYMIWMRFTHEDVSIWWTRWIQAYFFMPAQVKRIATDIITFNAAMSACENEDELIGPGHGCPLAFSLQRFALHPLGQVVVPHMTGVGACFGFDFLLEGLLQTPWNFHVDKKV